MRKLNCDKFGSFKWLIKPMLNKFTYSCARHNSSASRANVWHHILPPLGWLHPKFPERSLPLTCLPNLDRIGWGLPELFRKDWFIWPSKSLQYSYSCFQLTISIVSWIIVTSDSSGPIPLPMISFALSMAAAGLLALSYRNYRLPHSQAIVCSTSTLILKRE